jgi:hypothetical protein
VKRASLLATSQLTIMSSPAPGLPALPAAPGSAEWLEMRAAYVHDKERLLRQQHAEASRCVRVLGAHLWVVSVDCVCVLGVQCMSSRCAAGEASAGRVQLAGASQRCTPRHARPGVCEASVCSSFRARRPRTRTHGAHTLLGFPGAAPAPAVRRGLLVCMRPYPCMLAHAHACTPLP